MTMPTDEERNSWPFVTADAAGAERETREEVLRAVSVLWNFGLCDRCGPEKRDEDGVRFFKALDSYVAEVKKEANAEGQQQAVEWALEEQRRREVEENDD